jgi:hypothetical protein
MSKNGQFEFHRLLSFRLRIYPGSYWYRESFVEEEEKSDFKWRKSVTPQRASLPDARLNVSRWKIRLEYRSSSLPVGGGEGEARVSIIWAIVFQVASKQEICDHLGNKRRVGIDNFQAAAAGG